MDPLSLVPGVLKNEARAVARTLRAVDDRVPGSEAVLKALFPHTGRAYEVGSTGNPGAGKSTLTDRLVSAYRARGQRVAVLCVDPSSPYSGGAILGDRIRMGRHSTDPGVFIRSVATRGHLGGLSRSARDMVRVLDASGADVVLVETVGVGQDELEITRTAHTTLVVMAPGMGDEVQAIKAGIMEIADIYVVNKADREGADRMVTSIESNLALQSFGAGQWRPPIVRTEATNGKGLDELWATIQAFRGHTAAQRDERLAARQEYRLRDLLSRRFLAHVESRVLAAGEFDAIVQRIAHREVDPYTAAADVLGRALGSGGAR